MTGSLFANAAPDPHGVPPLAPSAILDSIGGRSDKNSVGSGRNVALYTGQLSKFFFATHSLGDVFSAADGKTIAWFPDHIVVSKAAPPGEAIHEIRDVCVTATDVIVARIHLPNSSAAPVKHLLEIAGDCTQSFDWRSKPGGKKETRRDGKYVLMTDQNVFPEFLPHGLSILVGSATQPASIITDPPGTYRLQYEVVIPASSTREITIACAIDTDAAQARQHLDEVLKEKDPLAKNRQEWDRFYQEQVPQFECSDPKLNEIYAFRWFLLKFSTAGGNLGLFRYPVVLEGRQAFQTYCCYSAPFMAMDLNWSMDPMIGFGQIADMVSVAYQDGRFPWYVSPRTNQVPLDHPSRTGCSLLPWAAWKFYQIHGRKDLLAQIYPGMKKNVQWWIADRDPDGNGLFEIDHQLETGMDDLNRRWRGPRPHRYEAVDATVYAYLNLRAVANMARELGHDEDARDFNQSADKTAAALNAIAWDAKAACYRDRNPQTGELSDYTSVCTFYPLLTDVPTKDQLPLIRQHLLNESEFWLPHPIPALSRSDPEFDPVKRYWAGPSWPAATCHVVEGFADTAKRLDRSLLPQAAELLRRAVNNHFTPRADFYERYDPFTGKPLSTFRDYMHSWWIDLLIRHAAGLMPQDDGTIVIDPLLLGLEHFSLRSAPHRGHRVDVLFNDAKEGPGVCVRIDGKAVYRNTEFQPGNQPVVIPAAIFEK